MTAAPAAPPSDPAAPDTALWVGRVARPGVAGPPVTVRARTGGASPGLDDLVEQIADPFDDADGTELELDAWQRAHRDPTPGGLRAPLGELSLAPPVRARTVFGIGRNYRAHAAELGNPVPSVPLVFLKAASCLLASGQPIPLPAGGERIDMESELVAVIGRRAHRVSAAAAWSHIAGYTLGIDVSNRAQQKADGQWTRAKGSIGFGPLGPMIRLTPPDFVPDTERWVLRGYLDDELRQEGRVCDMIFDLPTLVEHLSASMVLEPGDLIYTGTPEGVSQLGPGQVVRVELLGFELGRLINPCVPAISRSAGTSGA